MAGYTGTKDDYLKRLRRIEGQVRGISRMVEQDTYCIDVLTQVAAATKALQAVSLGLLEDHMSHCVLHALKLSGLTCDHCVAHVTEELKNLDGVKNVSVVLNKGGQSVAFVVSDVVLDDAALAAAVDEAGDYTLNAVERDIA